MYIAEKLFVGTWTSCRNRDNSRGIFPARAATWQIRKATEFLDRRDGQPDRGNLGLEKRKSNGLYGLGQRWTEQLEWSGWRLHGYVRIHFRLCMEWRVVLITNIFNLRKKHFKLKPLKTWCILRFYLRGGFYFKCLEYSHKSVRSGLFLTWFTLDTK